MSKNLLKITFCLFLALPYSVWSMGWQSLTIARSTHHAYRESLFNPDGFAVQELDLRRREYFFSQYLSLNAPLAGFDWRLDALSSARHQADWDNELKVQQFYLQKDLWQNWDLMAGRALLRWGTGYAFNPTDVLAPTKELSDPDNDEKRLSGNDLVKIEYFGPSYSLALVYLTDIRIDKKPVFNASKLAVRGYKNFWGIDLSLISLFNRDETPIWGGNFSHVFGERLELHGEFTSQKGSYQSYHRVIFDGNTFYRENPVRPWKKQERRSYNQLLVGINYTLAKNILWILEYYHQDQGYSKQEWQRITDYLRFLKNSFTTPLGAAARGNLLWSLNVISANGALRDYLMNHVNVPIHGNLELKATALANLNDGSYVLIPEADITVKNHFTFYFRSFIFRGNGASEYGALFRSHSLEGGLRVTL